MYSTPWFPNADTLLAQKLGSFSSQRPAAAEDAIQRHGEYKILMARCFLSRVADS